MACTSIMVGRLASLDGSVMTSHTCDCHRTGTQIIVVPAQDHSPGTRTVTRRRDDNTGAMERYSREPTGVIPQAARTLGYLSPTYAAMNEKQLAIGESTLGGRAELVSAKGLIDCESLIQILLERTATVREAIELSGRLLEEFGWCDEGEALTIADTQEVWLLEVFGPGKDAIGAVWAAQRVPDDHVSVIANGSRIGELRLDDTDHFSASSNVIDLAKERGWWDPGGSRPFSFYEAYNPDGRTSFAVTRREWRVFSLLAPGLKLNGNSNVFPFSIKPEKPLGPETIMRLFRDTYEGTDYDVCRDLKVENNDGKSVISPLANPFMPYEMNHLLRINGGWGWRGERQLARWYCMYATVTQSRSWLSDSVGGIVWFGYANPAMTTYAPLFAGIEDLPDDYKIDGRTTGFSRESAFWASRRVATLAAHRWGEMRHDIAAVRDPIQARLLTSIDEISARARSLADESAGSEKTLLTERSMEACREITRAYWDLGDSLWTRYDEKW